MSKITIKFLRALVSAIGEEKFKDGAHLTTDELVALQAAWQERKAGKHATIKL